METIGFIIGVLLQIAAYCVFGLTLYKWGVKDGMRRAVIEVCKNEDIIKDPDDEI